MGTARIPIAVERRGTDSPGRGTTGMRPFLTATWRHLAMLNFEVDPAALAALVPRGTELDTFEGRHLVSMVGFRFLDTRLRGIPIPFHRHFDEVNLRFYVRRRVDGEWRRAAVFVKEIVPRRAIAWVARACYGENYVATPMRHAITATSARYDWRHAGTWMHLGVTHDATWALPTAGSEAAFITEHYWGYARQRDGGTVEYEVVHPRWRVAAAEAAELECDATALYGAAFGEALAARPSSAFVVEGSAVAVHRGARVA